MAMNSFEQNLLLPILTTINQVRVLAAGPIVDTCLSLPHNLVPESRMQDPTSCARSEGNLHTTREVVSTLTLVYTFNVDMLNAM